LIVFVSMEKLTYGVQGGISWEFSLRSAISVSETDVRESGLRRTPFRGPSPPCPDADDAALSNRSRSVG